jgi:phosphohistidine phosphatase SixA
MQRDWRILILATAVSAAWADVALAQRAIVVVRHAEKLDQSEDPGLSVEGMSRARALADLLRAAGVTHILTSEYIRTKETARPLASRLKVTPQIVPAKDTQGIVNQLRLFPPEAVVLLVAHSNTIPPILTRLGWTGTLDLKDRDYDDVFMVVPRGTAEPSVLRLKYGRRTSP